MTQPAPGAPEPTTTTTPAPGAPALAPQPPAPAPVPQQQSTTQTGLDPNAPIDFDRLEPNVKAYIAKLRQEAGGHRQEKTAAQQTAAEAQQQRDAVLKALGLNPDGTALDDPAQAAAKLTQRATEAESAAWGANVKLEVFQLAGKLGANPAALLDSLTFVDSLDELTDADPRSAEFRTALEAKITAAVQANPNLKAAGGPPARSGGDFSTGGDKPPGSLDEQIAAAKKAGNWRQVIALENNKLAAAKQTQ